MSSVYSFWVGGGAKGGGGIVVVLVVVVVGYLWWWWCSGSGGSGDSPCKGDSFNNCRSEIVMCMLCG